MQKTKISWTDYTWNPITGCSPISAGCDHCYAKAISDRFHQDFIPTFHTDRLCQPFHLKQSSKIFVNSMGDLFHTNFVRQNNYMTKNEDLIIKSIIEAILDTIRQCPQHIFQILTKRPENIPNIEWPDNVWMGVTCEDNHLSVCDRIHKLEKIQCKIKFVSFEPLLTGMPFSEDYWEGVKANNVNWVIVGGETGPGAREMKAEWVDEIFEACQEYHIPFFFKQWGSHKSHRDKVQDEYRGKQWKEWPA